jgi:hypothetical protein
VKADLFFVEITVRLVFKADENGLLLKENKEKNVSKLFVKKRNNE